MPFLSFFHIERLRKTYRYTNFVRYIYISDNCTPTNVRKHSRVFRYYRFLIERDRYKMLVEQITGLLSNYCFWWTVLKHNFTLFVIFTFVISFFGYFLQYQNSLPPGPWGLPLLGYIPFMTSQLHRQYKKMAEKYGPIFCINFGCKPVIILANHDAIRAAFNRPEFAGRPNTPFIGIMEGYGKCEMQ